MITPSTKCVSNGQALEETIYFIITPKNRFLSKARIKSASGILWAILTDQGGSVLGRVGHRFCGSVLGRVGHRFCGHLKVVAGAKQPVHWFLGGKHLGI